MNAEEGPEDIRVSGLFSYPVKGGRAVSHVTADLLTTGLRHDREWMLVDCRRQPAQFLSQRELPEMATVTAVVVTEGGSDTLMLSAPGHEPLAASLTPGSQLRHVRVWNHETQAIDVGDDAANWFSRVLGMPAGHLRLVRYNGDLRRECNRAYAGSSGAHTFFADGYPVLVASESSLADLNGRMGRNGNSVLPMNRFRPNVVLSGLPAWDEDHLETISIGAAVLRLVKPCVRCQVTTTDQRNGERLSEEPLVTLARFRNNPDLGGVTFGWNAVVESAGTVSVGATCVAAYRF